MMRIASKNASKQIERRMLGFLKCSLMEYEIWEYQTCLNNENLRFFSPPRKNRSLCSDPRGRERMKKTRVSLKLLTTLLQSVSKDDKSELHCFLCSLN